MFLWDLLSDRLQKSSSLETATVPIDHQVRVIRFLDFHSQLFCFCFVGILLFWTPESLW